MPTITSESGSSEAVASARTQVAPAPAEVQATDAPTTRPALEGQALARGEQGLHRIVVVGGGAGGLELVTWLGDRLGKRGKAEVALVERARTHLWKPLLHEIAA